MTSFDRGLCNLQALLRTTFIALSFFLSIFGFAQGSPEDISGLEMWLDAGIGTTLDGSNKVTDWEDLSGNGHSATQGAGTLRPLWVDDVLNGQPVVRMDGTNDFMAFSEVNNARTIFWVIKEEATASANFRCLLGHSEVFDFLRGPENNIWHPDFLLSSWPILQANHICCERLALVQGHSKK